MANFEDRQRRFEAEFAHNAEKRFMVEARRDKIVGAWAAEKLGLSEDDAAEYATSVVRADLEEPGDDDVFRKLRADLDKARDKISDEEIREAMSEALEQAMQAVGAGS